MRISDWSSDVCSSDLPVAKKSAAAKKPAPSKGGLIKKLTNALKGKPAKSVAKKTPTAAKPAARPAPKKIAQSLAGKANVQNKGKPSKTAAVAKSPVKQDAKPKHEPPPPKPRAPRKSVVRTVGVQLNEDDISDMAKDKYMHD